MKANSLKQEHLDIFESFCLLQNASYLTSNRKNKLGRGLQFSRGGAGGQVNYNELLWLFHSVNVSFPV